MKFLWNRPGYLVPRNPTALPFFPDSFFVMTTGCNSLTPTWSHDRVEKGKSLIHDDIAMAKRRKKSRSIWAHASPRPVAGIWDQLTEQQTTRVVGRLFATRVGYKILLLIALGPRISLQ